MTYDDGVYTDPDLSRAFAEVLRGEPTEFALLAEEARWASLSGPCITINRPARRAERSAA